MCYYSAMTSINYNYKWNPSIPSAFSRIDASLEVPTNILIDNLKYLNVFWETEKMTLCSSSEIMANIKFLENISFPFNRSLESYLFLMMAGCKAIHIIPAPPFSFYK